MINCCSILTNVFTNPSFQSLNFATSIFRIFHRILRVSFWNFLRMYEHSRSCISFSKWAFERTTINLPFPQGKFDSWKMKKNFKLCLANIASRDAKQQFLLPVGETILSPKKIPKEILTLHNIVNIYDSAQRTQMEVKLKVALFLFPFFTVYTLKISNQPGSINFLFIFLFILNLLVAELSLSIVSMRKIKEKERERESRLVRIRTHASVYIQNLCTFSWFRKISGS